MTDSKLTDFELVELAKDGCGLLSEEGFDRLIALARDGVKWRENHDN